MTAEEPTSHDGAVEELRLALARVDDPHRRPTVIGLLDRPDVGAQHRADVVSAAGATLHGPALGWWFDVLDVRPEWSDEVDRLVRDRARDLLVVRRDAVLGRFSSPARGPGPYGAAAVARVLRILGPVPALERAWLRWIDEGRFDGAHPDDPGASTVRALAETLRHCVADGVLAEDHALVHGALAHWSELLRSSDPERRRRGLRVMAAIIALRHPFPSALPHMVGRALRHDTSPEASLVRSGVDALVRRDPERFDGIGARLAAVVDPSGDGAPRPRQRPISSAVPLLPAQVTTTPQET